MSQNLITTEVLEIISETADASSIRLRKEDFPDQSPKAGQYVTVEVDIDGNPERRAYSLSSTQMDPYFQFTVKRVKGGKVSNYLLDHVSKGSKLKVLSPEGKFVVYPEPEKSRDHYFFAAGSGITPVISMIKTLLEEEERSQITLLYGNRTKEDIIFFEELNKITSTYTGQISVVHTLSSLGESKGLFGLFGNRKTDGWEGEAGRINDKLVKKILDHYPPRHQDIHCYICGPGDMINTVEQSLVSSGLTSAQIHKEYFTPPEEKKLATGVAQDGIQTVSVILNGESFEVDVPADKTILEAVIDAGKNPPYSCTSGACASCIAKNTQGKIEMDSCFSLDDDEIADGLVLTCQSHPIGQGVEVDYDNV